MTLESNSGYQPARFRPVLCQAKSTWARQVTVDDTTILGVRDKPRISSLQPVDLRYDPFTIPNRAKANVYALTEHVPIMIALVMLVIFGQVEVQAKQRPASPPAAAAVAG